MFQHSTWELVKLGKHLGQPIVHVMPSDRASLNPRKEADVPNLFAHNNTHEQPPYKQSYKSQPFGLGFALEHNFFVVKLKLHVHPMSDSSRSKLGVVLVQLNADELEAEAKRSNTGRA